VIEDLRPQGSGERVIREFYAARARGDRAATRACLADDVAWHDPYPPPFGGDLRGTEAVFRDIFDGAEGLGFRGGFALHDVIANDEHVIALVDWWAEYRGRRMESREVGIFHVRDGRITEVWFHTEDQTAAWEFFV